MNESITREDIQEFGTSFDSKREHIVAMNAVVANGINQSAANVYRPREVRHSFSVSLPNVGDITNQKQSGRCWMFAALNVMRIEVMEKLNLKTFELSQNYPLFWDKLERSNW
ncbi:MAG: C1 family peptidase, partial [Sphaerochaetaceae bacterium]